jgi:hypothetical protein
MVNGGFHMKKFIYILVIISLLPSGLLLAGPPSTNVADTETTDHFSGRKISAASGDCGGYELWLTKNGYSLRGQLAVYEGSCETKKWEIESVQYDPKTGNLSFKAPYYQDNFVWEFKGTLKKDRVSGTLSLFEKASKESNSDEKLILLKVR